MNEIEAAELELEAAEVALEAAKERRYAARDRLRTLRRAERGSASGISVGVNAGGFVADVVTGGMNMSYGVIGSDVSVFGRIINGGVVKTCTNCGGQQGWHMQGGVMRHTGCGAIQ